MPGTKEAERLSKHSDNLPNGHAVPHPFETVCICAACGAHVVVKRVRRSFSGAAFSYQLGCGGHHQPERSQAVEDAEMPCSHVLGHGSLVKALRGFLTDREHGLQRRLFLLYDATYRGNEQLMKWRDEELRLTQEYNHASKVQAAQRSPNTRTCRAMRLRLLSLTNRLNHRSRTLVALQHDVDLSARLLQHLGVDFPERRLYFSTLYKIQVQLRYVFGKARELDAALGCEDWATNGAGHHG
jgi:hypothetical protein